MPFDGWADLLETDHVKHQKRPSLPRGLRWHSESQFIGNRAEQAMNLGIDTLQADTMDVRCPAETFSLLYLNPSYDLEVGQTNNQRLNSYF